MATRKVQIAGIDLGELIGEIEWIAKQDPELAEAYQKDVDLIDSQLPDAYWESYGKFEIEYDPDAVCDYTRFALDALEKGIEYS